MEHEYEARVRGVAGGLLERLEQAVRELDMGVETRRERSKDEAGEICFELHRGGGGGGGPGGGLTPGPGVLKDLQDILRQDDSMDARERELKLKQIERSLNAASDPGITVTLESEAVSYAQ